MVRSSTLLWTSKAAVEGFWQNDSLTSDTENTNNNPHVFWFWSRVFLGNQDWPSISVTLPQPPEYWDYVPAYIPAFRLKAGQSIGIKLILRRHSAWNQFKTCKPASTETWANSLDNT